MKAVKAWLDSPPKEIVSELLQKKGSLQKLLSERDVPEDMLNCLISALSRAYQEDSDDVREIVNIILKLPRFLKLHLPQHILRVRINSGNKKLDELLQQVKDVISVLDRMLNSPKVKNAADILPSLVLLGDVLKDMESNGQQVPDVIKASLESCVDRHKTLKESTPAKRKEEEERSRR